MGIEDSFPIDGELHKPNPCFREPLMANFGGQLDTSRKRTPQLENCFHNKDLWISTGHFIINVAELSHREWCHPQEGRPELCIEGS